MDGFGEIIRMHPDMVRDLSRVRDWQTVDVVHGLALSLHRKFEDEMGDRYDQDTKSPFMLPDNIRSVDNNGVIRNSLELQTGNHRNPITLRFHAAAYPEPLTRWAPLGNEQVVKFCSESQRAWIQPDSTGFEARKSKENPNKIAILSKLLMQLDTGYEVIASIESPQELRDRKAMRIMRKSIRQLLFQSAYLAPTTVMTGNMHSGSWPVPSLAR